METEKRLIYADELKTAIRDDVNIDGVNYAKMKKHINEAKTVDAVEVVHGDWIHHYHDSGEPIDDKWYCSECHMCNDHRRTWYYPNCGAKMDGERKDNEIQEL